MTTTSDSELFSWLKLFWTYDDILSYDLISDGYFLNEVFREIDPNAVTNDQLAKCRSILDKIKNWEILIKNIRLYYTIVLQQTFVIRLPSIITICYDQQSSKTQSEIDKTIFLILGAAVQCEKKEYFIQDIITRLPDSSIQHGLMGYIKQITEGVDTVINCISLEEFTTLQIVNQLRILSEQWEDSFIEDSKTILADNDGLQKQINDQKNQIQVLKNVGLDNGLMTFSSHSEKNSGLELAESKAKLRKLQNELDFKIDIINDLRDDLELQREENTKLKESQMKLTNESRRLRMLQDELDSQKELILRAPIIENENAKLKEKVNELEYYRVRCEELREDLSVIANENSNLLDKIENNRKIVERSSTLEVEYRKANRKVEELEQTISSHLAEISALEYKLIANQEKDNVYISSKSELENELRRLKKNNADGMKSSSFSDQVIEKTNAEIMRLEIANRSLTERLSEIKNEESVEINKLKEKISELEESKEKLTAKVLRFQDSNKKDIQQNLKITEEKQLILREKEQMEMEIKSIKESTNRIIEELNKENESLSETIMTIRERSEKSNDLRTNELEKENSKLHLSLIEGTHKLSKVEFDLQRTTQKCSKLEESLDKSHQEHLQLSKNNADLEKEISNLKMFKSRLEELQDKFSQIEVEKLRLEALVSEYHHQLQQSTTTTNDTLEENIKELALENQRKTSQLLMKISELESELLKSKSENDKLLRKINQMENKIKSLEQDIENYKNELANYNRLESKFKLTERNVKELEKEREELQSQNLKLEHDIKLLDKENRRSKNQYEVHCSSIENYQARINDLETKIHLLELDKFDKEELDAMQSSVKETEKRLNDSEVKNRELLTQVKDEKKQCTILREELLNERIESQNLKNQLQKLTDELEKLGISQIEADEEKFKILESKVNSTVGDTINKKDQKIADLQTKLTSSTNSNAELTKKLKLQIAKYASLEEKYEEELAVLAVQSNQSASAKKDIPSFTQHLFDLKDDLIKVERQNAQLESEKQYLVTHCQELKDSLANTDKKYSQQLDNIQTKYNNVNNENMKLDIKATTLKTQLESLRAINNDLSNQLSVNEKNLSTTMDEINSLQKVKQQLEIQCSSLQNLNNQLSSDYEVVKKDATLQKSINRSITTRLNKANDELSQFKKDSDGVKHLKDILENEKNSLEDGARQLIRLREENNSLIEEKNEVLQIISKLDSELKAINQENKFIKCEHNKEKEISAQLKEKLTSSEAKLAKLERELSKLESKVESLSNQNESLSIENQKLLHQMKDLLMQNQGLISEILQNRQNQHSEEVALRDRLNHLQRHKERLEEKIMEHYKTMPSAKKTTLNEDLIEPKGARNKFMKRARDMLKRRDSKSSIEQERKSSSVSVSFRRSRSCGNILGDRSSECQTDQTDMSDNIQVPSDSEGSEVDCMCPTPKSKPTPFINSDTYSIMSSVSSQKEPNGSIYSKSKFIPQSIPAQTITNERRQSSEISNVVKISTDKKIEGNNYHSTVQKPDITNIVRKEVNVKPSGRNSNQYAQPISSSNKRSLPSASITTLGVSNEKNTPLIFGSISSKNTSNQNDGDNSSVSSNEMSIIVAPTKKSINSSYPSVPTRKTSLPVTDRVEEDIINPDTVHDFIRSSVNENSPRPLSKQSSRPQSTIPGSASSKTILQRLQKNQRGSMTSETGSRGRPHTPNAETARLNNSANYGADNSHQINITMMKPRPQTSLGDAINQSHGKKPMPLMHKTDSSNARKNFYEDSMENRPTPPTRRESGRPKSNHDSGSNTSEKSDKHISKPKKCSVLI